MSNSDDPLDSLEKLDALYKTTELTSEDAVSPPDIDDTLRAAARSHLPEHSESTTQETGRPIWQRRYGWATAATLLLTSALFLSLPDTAPPENSVNNSLSSKSRAESTVDLDASGLDATAHDKTVQAQPAIELEATPESLADSIAVPVPVPVAPQLEQRKKQQDVVVERARKARQVSQETAAVKQAPPAIAYEPPTAATADEATADQASSRLEEVIVTGSYRSGPQHCERFDKLLISKVCRDPRSDPVRNRTQDASESEQAYALHASRASNCAGQMYILTTVDGQPEPHPSSTKSRFVLLQVDDQEPQQELICKFGRLKLQPLARGR